MIAITGAAGFIGSNLAHRLASHDLVLVDDHLTSAKAANLGELDRFRYLGHRHFVTELQSGRLQPKAIYHLGACSSTTETNWDYLTENNIVYTQTLWNWCAAHGATFIYASSAATYGDGSKGFDDQTPAGELTPLNLYGKSKNDFDIWALTKATTVPPRWAGLKFFNVYGPREQHKGRMASMVWHSYRQILQTGKVRLFDSTDPAYAPGGQLRDFVFVEDCIDHMLWLADHPHQGGVYNSGTGTPRSFLDLAKAVFAAMGREPVIEFIPMPADLAKQYQNYTKAEMGKLRATGFTKAPTTLEAGVAAYLAFLSQNP